MNDKNKELIQAINVAFGEGKISGAVFFEHNPDGSVKTLSPLFQMPKIIDPNCKPGEGIRELVNTLKSWSKALDYMANELVKEKLPKN